MASKKFTGTSNPFANSRNSLAKKDQQIQNDFLRKQQKLKKAAKFNTEAKAKKKTAKKSVPFIGMSKGEALIHAYLTHNSIHFEPEKELKKLRSPITKAKLRMDFYLPVHNICIEFDGRQHFKPSKRFDSPTCTLESRQTNDRFKDAYCERYGIRMVRISYLQINQINEILDDIFKLCPR